MLNELSSTHGWLDPEDAIITDDQDKPILYLCQDGPRFRLGYRKAAKVFLLADSDGILLNLSTPRQLRYVLPLQQSAPTKRPWWRVW
jgi:hypothetical protein